MRTKPPAPPAGTWFQNWKCFLEAVPAGAWAPGRAGSLLSKGSAPATLLGDPNALQGLAAGSVATRSVLPQLLIPLPSLRGCITPGLSYSDLRSPRLILILPWEKTWSASPLHRPLGGGQWWWDTAAPDLLFLGNIVTSSCNSGCPRHFQAQFITPSGPYNAGILVPSLSVLQNSACISF